MPSSAALAASAKCKAAALKVGRTSLRDEFKAFADAANVLKEGRLALLHAADSPALKGGWACEIARVKAPSI